MCARTVLPKLSFLNLAVLAVTPRGALGKFSDVDRLSRSAQLLRVAPHATIRR